MSSYFCLHICCNDVSETAARRLGKQVSGHPGGLRMSQSGDMATGAGAPCVTLPPTEDQEEERPLRPLGRRGAWRYFHPIRRTSSTLFCGGRMFRIPHCVLIFKRERHKKNIYFFSFHRRVYGSSQRCFLVSRPMSCRLFFLFLILFSAVVHVR